MSLVIFLRFWPFEPHFLVNFFLIKKQREFPSSAPDLISDFATNVYACTTTKHSFEFLSLVDSYSLSLIIHVHNPMRSIQFYSQVQLQLLTAIVKLFLKRPTDTQELVQQVLSLATQDSDNPDLRDRGYIYWRLLSTDPAAAKVLLLLISLSF